MTNLEIDANGSKYWYNKQRQWHRTAGPAVEYKSGNKRWYLNGHRHRTDGPAVEFTNGDKRWYENDQLHRTTGPAIEDASGRKRWYIRGTQLTEEEFTLLAFVTL